MKGLLATTAIAAVAAAPLAAATDSEPRSVTEAFGANEITVAELINRDVYAMTERNDEVGWSDWTAVPENFDMTGEIEDLLLNEQGEVETAVLGQGGILDIGGTELRVDIEHLGIVMDADDRGKFYVVYTGDPSALKAATPDRGPGDAAGEDGQPAMAAGPKETGQARSDTAPLGAGVDNTDRQPPQASSVRLNRIEKAERGDYFGATPAIEEKDGFTEVTAESLTAEDVEWAAVYTSDGEWVGDIGDLVLNEDGEITEAIVEMGGFLGIGETPVAVPFHKVLLKRNDENGALRAYVQMNASAIEDLKSVAKES